MVHVLGERTWRWCRHCKVGQYAKAEEPCWACEGPTTQGSASGYGPAYVSPRTASDGSADT